MKYLLNKCPICGAKLYHDTLRQYAVRQFFKKDGELSQRSKKIDYGTFEAGIICCSECDFSTTAELKGEPPHSNIKISVQDDKYYWENLDESDEETEEFCPTEEELKDFIKKKLSEYSKNVDIKISTTGDVNVYYQKCLIIEHLTKLDDMYIRHSIAMFGDLQRRKNIVICDIYKEEDSDYYNIDYGKRNEKDEIYTAQVYIPEKYQGKVRCVFDLLDEDTL